jgi:hypothetical protein
VEVEESDRTTYARISVEDIDIFPRVEVVDGTLTVDLEGVCGRPSV